MERLRAELLRRARSEGQGDVEQGMAETTSQAQPMAETTASRTNVGRFGLLPLQLSALPQLFSSRRRPARQTENEIESPKSPEFVSRRPPTLPPMHLEFSSLADSFGPNTNAARPPLSAHPSLAAPSSIYSQDAPTSEQPARPSAVARIETVRSASAGSINTPDPAEAELARLGIDGRRRHERQQRRREQAAGYGSERSRKSKPPTRFLFCFPWVKSRRMRSQILRCFVSGTFLLILLSVCECSTLPH